VEPRGGFGSNGLYTLSLLNSQDVSSLIVSLYSPEQAAFDFSHADLFQETSRIPRAEKTEFYFL